MASIARGRPGRQFHRHGHRHRGQRRQPGQGGVKATVGQHRRVHAADQVPQFGQRLLGLLVGLADDRGGRLGVGAELGLGPAEFHRQRHQPLLCAVVQVPLDAHPLRLGRIHDLGPAGLQLADPGGQLFPAGAEQPLADRRVPRGHPAGQRRRGQQQHQPCQHASDKRPGIADQVPGDVGAATGQRPVVGRRGDQHRRDRPHHGDQHELQRAEREPDQPVQAVRQAAAELSGAHSRRSPLRSLPGSGAAGMSVPSRTANLRPLGVRHPEARPERARQHRDAGQEDRHQGDRGRPGGQAAR